MDKSKCVIDVIVANPQDAELGAHTEARGEHMPLPGVPEIDPSSGTSALTLLAGAVAVIRGWRKKVSDPQNPSKDGQTRTRGTAEPSTPIRGWRKK